MRPDEPRSVGRRLHPFVSLLSWHELAVVSLPSFPCLLVLKQDEQLLFGGLLQSLRLYFQRMWTRASRPETRASESPLARSVRFARFVRTVRLTLPPSELATFARQSQWSFQAERAMETQTSPVVPVQSCAKLRAKLSLQSDGYFGFQGVQGGSRGSNFNPGP